MSKRIAEITQRTGKYKEPTRSNYPGESRSDDITFFCSQCIAKRIITVMALWTKTWLYYALYIFLVNYILVANNYSVILYYTDKNCHLFSKVLKSEDNVAPAICAKCPRRQTMQTNSKLCAPESVSAQQPYKLCLASKAKTKKRKKSGA